MVERGRTPATTSGRASSTAAARLLREKGASAVTTRAVAQAAGVQAPTIYRLFGDKDGLIDAVAEHVMATYVAGKSVAAAEPRRAIRSRTCAPGGSSHVEFGLANPELYALLTTPGRGAPSPATAPASRCCGARVHRIAAAGLLRVDEQRAVAMIHCRRHRNHPRPAGDARRPARPRPGRRDVRRRARQHPRRRLRRHPTRP